MTAPFSLVLLDADDTLWENEVYFRSAEHRLGEILESWADRDEVAERLLATEHNNIPLYGFGAKAFVLSMLETALEVSDHQIGQAAVTEIIALGKSILSQPVEFLEDVELVVHEIAQRWPIVVVTKGDLIHQEAKIMQSGLAHLFRSIEIVAEKDVAAFTRICDRYSVSPTDIVMVGNSVRSDIIPVLDLGGYAVHVPYEHAWAFEIADLPQHPRLREAQGFADVPAILAELSAN